MKVDPEIGAMQTIARALDELDEQTRHRVIQWARARYGLAASGGREAGAGVSAQQMAPLTREKRDVMFSDVADLYGAANPETDADKVLIVAFWFQVIRGETELDSQTINNELKNLGYPIGNVTRAVGALASVTPRLVLQTKKAGTTKQARKKFRLTVEGIKRAEQMANGGAARSMSPDAASE